MSDRGELVVAEAREWLGTKFHAQASVKGVGCDCKGLVWGVARELGFPEADSFYARFIHYDISGHTRTPGVPHKLLTEGMAALFDRADAPAPGDILLLAQRGKPVHLAICAGDTAIHAQIGSKDWVKETAMRALLTKFQLHSAWRWKERADG